MQTNARTCTHMHTSCAHTHTHLGTAPHTQQHSQRLGLKQAPASSGTLAVAMKRPQCYSEHAQHTGTSAKKTARAVNSAAVTETKYGRLVKELKIADFVIPYMCPFALVSALSETAVGSASSSSELVDCPSYASILRHSIPEGVKGRIALYMDGVTPGNPLRPTSARPYYAFFWTFVEYPDWFRSSQVGWHDICVVRETSVKEIPGGVSAVMSRILEIFFSEDGYNFDTLGVRVAGPRLIKASFGAFLLDERAEKAIVGVTGSSGSKPCMSCRNVVARIEPERVERGFRHFTLPGLGGCSLHTHESFTADLEYLKAMHGTMGKTAFKKQQQFMGICYEPHGLLFGPMQRIAKLPETRMHGEQHDFSKHNIS